MPLNPEIYVTADQVTAAWPAFAKLGGQEQTDLIADASAAAQNYVRRNLLQQTYDEVYDGKGLPRIWLKVRPVVAISAVSIAGDPLDNTYGSAWHFIPDTGELTRGDGQDDPRFAAWFPSGRGNVRVVYAAGYADVPGPVKRATIFIARWLYEMGRLSFLQQSETIGDYSYTLNPNWHLWALPPAAQSLLAAYVQDDIV